MRPIRQFILVFLSFAGVLGAAEKPNILFIAIDDLRAELGCYGSEIAKSPHIDALAATGVRFSRAYCQQAICGPSRASVMTGLRPDASQIHGNHTHFRTMYPDIITLPQHFKNHGYHTRSMGKIYHGVFPKGASRTVPDTFGDEPSWSIPTFRPGPRYYYTEEGITAAKQVYQQIYKPTNPGPDDWTKKLVFGPATEAPDVADHVLYDGQVADRAVESLQELAKSDDPFFLAVGFIKPHSPYIAPKEYWDLYEPESIPLASPESRVTNAPAISRHNSGELRRYTDQQKKGPISEADQRRVRHAYLACISYIDAQVGRVLSELEKQKLDKDTIVVLWSDHGYHLGEKDLWGKTTNFELDTRVPLIIRVPGEKPGVCDSPVELVDLYPTLAELSGLPVESHLQGTSLVPSLKDTGTAVKTAAFSQYTRGKMRGYSVRTKTHRYTEWIDMNTGKVSERLLFDHRADPLETKNVAATAKAEVIESMSRLLDRGEGWRNTGTPTLTLARPFTDHMVLQRDRPNRIWGTAPPGEPITGDFPWGQLFTKADENGRWALDLPPFGAVSEPQTITIRTEAEELQLNDILFGDVWMCSGQSNMRWMLKDTEEAKQSIAGSANPQLRICNLAATIHPGGAKFPLLKLRSTFADNLYESDGWQIAGPETVPGFSGVAYHFGRHLQAEAGVPIGLIHNSVGGSPMEAWIPDNTPDPNWVKNADLQKWVAGRAQLNLTHWDETEIAPAPHHPFEPGFLFRSAVEPFTNLAIRGTLWYQGESNATTDGSGSPPMDPKKNFALHKQLIESWRHEFHDEDMPFYFVQLPGLNRDWAAFREVQSKIDLLVPNTHMAVTYDLGHPTNVHPTHKKPVGERLANLALKYEHGKDLTAEPPRFLGWVNGKDSIQLRFDRPVATVGDAVFSVAGTDRKFRQITASGPNPSGFTLTLHPVDPTTIASIRFAWENDPKPTVVCADTGLPILPFRTDSWPLVSAAAAATPPPVSSKPPSGSEITSFENAAPGEITELETDGITLSAERGHAEIDRSHAHRGKQCLRLLGGKDREVILRFSEPITKGSIFAFQAERWTKRSPFAFHIFGRSKDNEKWQPVYDSSSEIKVGRAFLSAIRFSLPLDVSQLKLVSTTPDKSGVLIDDIHIFQPTPFRIGSITTNQPVHPVLIGKKLNGVMDVLVNIEGTIGTEPVVEGFRVSTAGTDRLSDVAGVSVLLLGKPFGTNEELAPAKDLEFSGRSPIGSGQHVFRISYRLNPTASLDRKVDASCSEIKIDGKWHKITNPSPEGRKRIGFALRQQGQDGVNSTRIPGLATTNAGTLIAVYDNRNRARGDLPGDIDVGMNRSTDGGQSWEPMTVIMDMGDDPKWSYDGIGDPAVLVDRKTGTIWVAATWSHGERSWFGSGPGLEPEETGQLMLVKSDDDGLTWSKPINITKQVKDPKWRFVLQGPGKGITMRDGTLVFPAQFRGENDEPVNGKPFSTLIYSRDQGKTWKIGTGVKIDTTEAQLVELGDGSIMINCRDNRGGSRSIYTTTDLGTTWNEHASNRGALPEPVCMASLIRVESEKHGPLLFFSNPPQRSGRNHMTIKMSHDEGTTWPEKWHTLVDERSTAYSCMTAVGKDKIGLVYEAPGELYFVRYTIEELLQAEP
ncbi:MAG: sulfatase-like hydrolase/transferase [Verrucomicrobiales bacterium]|nr:sulfatase-like hydrolase/transferase [Verrucomicrobiales bacterium]